MASAAQITANRTNAAHSTGPRTPEGKARCAANAIRHGLTAATLVVRDDERDAFEALRAGLLEQLAPVGAIETVVFDDLLHASWNLERFRRLEAEHGADLDNPEAAAFLDRLGRYQSRAQRAFYRALKELRVLQTNRALRAWKLAEEDEPSTPAIADINELTKQTHSEVKAKALDVAVKWINYDTGLATASLLRSPSAAPQQSDPENAQPAGPRPVPQPLSNPALRL